MKTFFLTLLVITPCLAATIGAVLMALNHVQGWGWLVLLAILLSPTVKIGKGS